MTFWRQGSNDSLSDKLVRPRSSGSYWDRKPTPKNTETAETPLRDAADVFSDVTDDIGDKTEAALESSKDEITKAVETIFPEESEALDEASLDAADDLPELPDAPSLDETLDNVDLDDVLATPPSLDELDDNIDLPDAPSESSLQSLSLDQENESDLDDDSGLGIPPTHFESETETLEVNEDLEIPDIDVKELETQSLEDQDLDIPELEEIDLNSTSSDEGKMPPVLPVSGHASGNAAHKFDEEEFQNDDDNKDPESESVAVADAVKDNQDNDIEENVDTGNESGQIIEFRPNGGRGDIAASADNSDDLTEEERLAVSLSEGESDVNASDSKFSTRITKPKSDGPIVTPRQTAASYYDTDEQVYEAGFDHDDGYYVPAHESDGSGKKVALYLAGAASISAICAAVYFMLPKGSDETIQTADAGSDATPSLPQITTRDASTTSAATTNAATATDAALDDSRVFSDLEATGTEEATTAISEPVGELFASTTEAADDIAKAPSTERNLSSNTTTLSTPELKTPEVSTPKVTEKAPELTLSAPKVSEPTTPTIAAPVVETKTVEPPPVAKIETPKPSYSGPSFGSTTDNATPKTAPKIAKRKLFGSNRSENRPAKILRTNTTRSVAPIAVSVGERVYDGVLRAGSMPQTIIDALFANGTYLAGNEQKQFAYNVRHAAKTTADGEINTVVTQNGTRVDLHFLSTQNEVRPTFITRSDKVEPLPRYMLLQDDWVRVANPTKLYAAPTQFDQTVLRSLSLSTSMERMGVVTDSSGEQWSLIGQNGVAIGYVPSADLTSLSGTGTTSVNAFKTNISSSVIERIDVSVPCRDYAMTVNGTGSMHSACMTPDGDWMSKEGAASGLSYTTAPPTTSFTSSTPTIVSDLAYRPPAPERTELSEDAEAILFKQETLRRDARHGQGSASQRIGSLFGQVDAKSAVSISSPDGRIGELEFEANPELQKISSSTSQVTLKTGLVQLDKQVRLMNAPAGTIVPEAETVMRGDVLEAISVSTTPTGESWTLVGENGVGYGYVRTDYTSSMSTQNVESTRLYDGFNAAQALGGAPAVSDAVEVNFQPAAPECQTAVYDAGGESGTLKACLQPNGTWTAEIIPNSGYEIRSAATDNSLLGGPSF
ncbi:superantigen-like protein SSL4 [Hirschia maritima]|uniref:hypothetical protein n=1 Tax=Hirschia maritima TaxID=1121961 RepID=UPI00036AFA7B|nr:hypothetical protein [Hirschia maritima]